MNKKIIWKLAILFTLILLLFTAVMGVVFFVLFSRHTEDVNRIHMEERAVSIAETMASFQGGNETQEHGVDGYGIYLEFLDELAVEDVWVVDKNGSSVTYQHGHSGHEGDFLEHSKVIPTEAKDVAKKVLENECVYAEDTAGSNRQRILTVGAPIYAADKTLLGAVLLQSPVSGHNNAVKYGQSALFIGSAAAMLFSVSASIFLSWYFTRPLRRMKDTALKLADGEYTAKTNIHQADEIGELAQTMDLLADRLKQAEDEREALDQMKEDFVANVSHELRTPVAVQRGYLEILCDKTVEDLDEVVSYHHQMLLESRHMERLVNDLLDLSRLQSIGFRLEKEELNLLDVIRDSMRAVRRAAQEKNLPLAFVGEEESCIIWGDYVRIRQMLLILLDNAMKFADAESTIEIGLSRNQNEAIMWVKNQGIVIAEEDLPHIFERFHKTCSTRNEKGTGLGLSIAEQIAKRHNADIQVESKAGFTKFSICFMLGEAEN